MAIYHAQMTAISRAAGRSAAAAAAYRSASVIVDPRTGQVHDYTAKRGVLGGAVILPGGGTVDRAELWERIEDHHKRGDATTAREIEVSLPVELPAEQRAALAMRYARELADRYGVAADVALHAPRTVTDRDLARNPEQHWVIDPDTGRRHNGNWHAHIMLTACHVQPDGTPGKKAVALDPIHCQRHKLPNAADHERGRWADLVNAALYGYGSAARVDHRSHAQRGIEAEPSRHLGPQAHGYERRTGLVSQVRQRHETEVAERQAEKDAQNAQEAALEAEMARALADLGKMQLEAALRASVAPAKRTAAEVAAEIERLRPRPLVEIERVDHAVMAARIAIHEAGEDAALARAHASAAAKEAQAWRDAHPVLEWRHRMGVGQSPALLELEQRQEAHAAEAARQEAFRSAAAACLQEAREVVAERVRADQAPALAKITELEALRQKLEQAERAEQAERQRIEDAQRRQLEQAEQARRDAAEQRRPRPAERDDDPSWSM